MFEAVADTFSLPRRVLQEDSQLPQVHPSHGKLQASAAGANSVGFTSSARATRMDHEIVDSKQERPLNFFPKRVARLLQHQIVGGGEVDEVVAVDSDWGDFGRSSRLTKE
jgi:hypothetical protein